MSKLRVERIQSVYPEGIQIRTVSSNDAACESASTDGRHMITELRDRPTDPEYLAADEFG